MALLEADVNFKVVKQFVKAVEERAIGQDVMNGLNPGQMVIKIVNEEMTALMGSETTEIPLQPGKAMTVLMMCGLQGAGKNHHHRETGREVQAERQEASAGGLRCLSSGCHRTAADQRGKAAGGRVRHGNRAQAGEYREGRHRARGKERAQHRDPGYRRTAAHRCGYDGGAAGDQGKM